MISEQAFGRTGHASTRIVFGAWALCEATQAEADRVLELLLEHGVNHIDTARMYGNAAERIGPWLDKHRADLFIATKTRSRTRRGPGMICGVPSIDCALTVWICGKCTV